jgi:serine/threonine-protein kinase Chk1
MVEILGYQVGQDIGEGGQARVKLGFSSKNNQFVAIKILEKKSRDKTLDIKAAIKEFRIHSSISHQNIIKMFQSAEDEHNVYFILEYAAAGELFDKIEPDVGIDEEVAHFYFNQLIAATDYLHSLGICHRDLKPEVFFI